MGHVMYFRGRTGRAFFALLTGHARPFRPKRGDVPDHLLQDVGLPEGRPQDRIVSHLGIVITPIKA
jgi:hypothetical protein